MSENHATDHNTADRHADKVDIEELLRSGMSVQISPQGTSMYPMIRQGRDQVIIEPVNAEEVRRGDVLLYRRDHSILVLHRLHHHSREGLYMVGDNQTLIEGPVRPDQIRGRMAALVRGEKMISTGSFGWIITGRVWLFLRPLRPYIKKAGSLVKRLVRHIAGDSWKGK